MTEQEYFDLSDRVKISTAYQTLATIVPESSSVIEKKEFQSVMKIISSWETKLFNIKFIE